MDRRPLIPAEGADETAHGYGIGIEVDLSGYGRACDLGAVRKIADKAADAVFIDLCGSACVCAADDAPKAYFHPGHVAVGYLNVVIVAVVSLADKSGYLAELIAARVFYNDAAHAAAGDGIIALASAGEASYVAHLSV